MHRPSDPRWGFSVAGRSSVAALQSYLAQVDPGVAYPGFHLARAADPAQVYSGGWRFSPDYGADISQTPDGAAPDNVRFTFWGTDAGLRVRRADFRARLYVTIDGEPANALPRDEYGAALVLTSPDPAEDYVTTETVARNLTPGEHVMVVTTSRGWDQWALNGFSVGYNPLSPAYPWWIVGLLASSLLLALGGVFAARSAGWGPAGARVSGWFAALEDAGQLGITAVTAAVVALTGWLVWGEQLSGIYRRLGDGGQLALTASGRFDLLRHAGLLHLHPGPGSAVRVDLSASGLGLGAGGLQLPFLCHAGEQAYPWLSVLPGRNFHAGDRRGGGAARSYCGAGAAEGRRDGPVTWPQLRGADYAVLAFTAVATLSLLFHCATGRGHNEWRTVILEPVLFYAVLRGFRPREEEMWVILDAFVLGGIAVALIGLGQYSPVANLITAEGGLLRLRSVYGSPNNVALYLGRILPLLVAMLLLGRPPSSADGAGLMSRPCCRSDWRCCSPSAAAACCWACRRAGGGAVDMAAPSRTLRLAVGGSAGRAAGRRAAAGAARAATVRTPEPRRADGRFPRQSVALQPGDDPRASPLRRRA